LKLLLYFEALFSPFRSWLLGCGASGLPLQDEAPLLVISAGFLIRDLQGKLSGFPSEPPNEPDEMSVQTIAQDLNGLAVQPP